MKKSDINLASICQVIIPSLWGGHTTVKRRIWMRLLQVQPKVNFCNRTSHNGSKSTQRLKKENVGFLTFLRLRPTSWTLKRGLDLPMGFAFYVTWSKSINKLENFIKVNFLSSKLNNLYVSSISPINNIQPSYRQIISAKTMRKSYLATGQIRYKPFLLNSLRKKYRYYEVFPLNNNSRFV